MKNKTKTEVKRTSIGGQALIEGVMMRGPQKTALAVRHTSGEIRMDSWDNEKSKRHRFFNLPFVRGIFNFIDSMCTGYKSLMRSAELSGLEDDMQNTTTTNQQTSGRKQKNNDLMMKLLMAVAAVLGIVLAIFLFTWLPTFIYGLLKMAVSSLNNRYLQAIFEGLLKMTIFLGYLCLVSLMKDIKRTFMYHGAEHKTIFCYENGLELTADNVRKQCRFHPRCGTSFIILMLLIGIFVSMLIPHTLNSFLRTVIKILCLPFIMGIGYEAIKLAGRKNNQFTRIISAPGLWVQRISTKEPTDDMIECAIKAFKSVIPESGQLSNS